MEEDVTCEHHEVDACDRLTNKIYFLCLLLTERLVKEDRTGGRKRRGIELGLRLRERHREEHETQVKITEEPDFISITTVVFVYNLAFYRNREDRSYGRRRFT